ncbi:MAG: BTAD domain-containing putative transcriptional regulator [Acidimicrobiales bacterium]
MRFRMLGELQVADGHVDVPIRGAKQRALLLLLLVRAGETVRAERLADELWGDDVPAGGANALQALVSKLRRALGPLSGTLTTSAGGYRLDVPDEEIDARRFEAAAAVGREALRAGDVATAGEALRAGLELWRGPALDGSDDEGVLHREAARLEDLRWAVLEDRIDCDLRSGHDAALVAELEHLVGEAPLRERLHGHLMLALYRAGRQAEALRAYQAARAVLGGELGLDPGPELQALEASILDQDPALLLTRARAGGFGRRSNITEGLSRFIGRERDLSALEQLVADRRLVTIVGPGGAGKTRLALEHARGQPEHDAFLVDLAPVGDPAAVPEAVAVGVGLRERGPIEPDASAGLDRLVEHLADRPTIVVMDNCEHVIVESARVVEHLLVHCPLLRVVATSREALGLGGETIWPVPPLAIEDAVELFTDRAGAAGADRGSLGSTSVVEDVCTRLDGLPLAIELAAARVRVIPVQQLADRLDDRFRLLTGGARTALPRQQTLRAVVEWSYDLLFDDEQHVFELLSVFAGGCTLEAAEAVCAGEQIATEDVADLLAHLVDKSLVVAHPVDGEVRFHLLQTLALFGRERLAASKAAYDARARHAAHYLELAERGPAAFRGEQQVAWLAEIAREGDNLRSALAWFVDQQDAEAAQRLVGGMGWTWWMGGNGEEGLRWFDSALSSDGSVDPRTRALALAWACAVGTNTGQGVDLAIARGEEAVAVLRDVEPDDRVSLGDACELLALAHMRPAHPRSLELFDEAVALCSARDDGWSRAVAASAGGLAAGIRGDLQAALDLHLASMEHFEAIGAEWAVANVGSDIARVVEARGDLDAAVAFTERALLSARRLNLQLAEIQLGARLGNLRLCQGDVDAADALHEEAMALAESVGSRVSYSVILTGRCMVRWAQGRLQEAAAAAAQALAVYRRTQLVSGQALSLALLGFVTERLGDVRRADELHTEALAAARQLGDERLVALALEGLAGVAVARGDHERGATLLGLAGHLRGVDGAVAGPASDDVRIGEVLLDELGPERFDELRREGRSADIDALVG